MTLVRLTPRDGEAVLPLADCKTHLRVDGTEEDTLISIFRGAAIAHVEMASGVSLSPAQYIWTLPRFAGAIDLPMRPVTEILSVTYNDAAGVANVYEGAQLIGNAAHPAAGEAWPYASAHAAVTFAAGLQNPNEEPDLIAAALLLLGHLYTNREAVGVGDNIKELPLGVSALIGLHRQVLV